MSDAVTRALLVLLVIAVIAVVLWGMRRGWLAREARQSDIAAPEPIPAPLGHVLAGPVQGRYLGSVTAGEWLDRIVAHGLGTRSRAEVTVASSGLACARTGATDLFIPVHSLRSVRADRGIAGRVYERGGVLVVTWELGGRLVDSGFRADRSEDQQDVMAAIESVLAQERTA